MSRALHDIPSVAGESSGEPAVPSVSPRLVHLLKGLAWAYVALVLAKDFAWRPFTISGVDFPKHWLAPVAILESRNNYVGDELWLFYNYPQWSALVTFWLGWLSRETAEIVWKAINAAFVLMAWWLSFRHLRPPDPSHAAGPGPNRVAPLLQRAVAGNWLIVSAILFAGFDPAAKTVLFTGNIDPWNLLAMTALVAALLSGRDRLAGMAWAVLCLVKMVPVLLIVPIVLWRRWRMLYGWVLFMGCYLALLVATDRIPYEWFFVTKVVPEISFEWRWISISFPQFLLEYVMPEVWHEDPLRYDLFVNGVLALFAAAMFGGIARLRNLGADFLRVLEFCILYLPLLSPLLEGHHYSWALPALFLQLARWFRGDLPSGPGFVYALGWFIVSRDFFYIDKMHNLGEWPEFMPMFGGLLLAAAAFTEMRRSPRLREAMPPHPPPPSS